MDIFNHFIYNHNKNTPRFSEFFNSINELKLTHNDKSYILDHYISMFFRLLKQMDFTYLQEKIHCLFKKSFEEVADSSEKFHYQEPKINENLLILSMAYSIIEELLSDFTTKIYYYCCEEVDIIGCKETEKKLINLIGKEKFEVFHLMLS